MRRMRVTSLPFLMISIPTVAAVAYGIHGYLGGKFRGFGNPASHAPSDHGEAEVVHGPRLDSHAVNKKPHKDADSGAGSERKSVSTAHGVLSQDGVCSSFEYFVSDAPGAKPSAEEWATVMALYHAAKGGLLAWTQENHTRIPEPTLKEMERAVKEVRIHRPPSHEEPELAFRGVGVLSEDMEGKPMIRLGAGFIRLIRENPARAKFELARLVAQTWSPCSLEKSKVQHPWTALLGCVGVDAAVKCDGSPYSEAGWAVSSVVAIKVANPGCELPALVGPEKSVCVSKVPLPLNAAPENGVREARR